MRGVKVFGCEACVFGERYQHTCGVGKYTGAFPGLFPERLPGRASCYSQNEVIAAVVPMQKSFAEVLYGMTSDELVDRLTEAVCR